MVGFHSYEVFLALPECPQPGWNWLRLARNGLVVAAGSTYPSLDACFVALRRDREARGKAPVTINLNGAGPDVAAAVVAIATAEGDVTITCAEPRIA